MAILAFQKPDKVLMLEADDNTASSNSRPLEPGFGITVGNVCAVFFFHPFEDMLSIPCVACGVEVNEFASVPGVKRH